MFTRSLALVLVVGAVGAAGCVASGEAAEDQPAVSQNGLVGGFNCDNSKIDVLCHGSSLGTVLVPVEVIVKDVGIGVLDSDQLNILSQDLDNVSILNGGILNNDQILNDVGLVAFNDILSKFLIDITKNEVNVCTSALLATTLCQSPK